MCCIVAGREQAAYYSINDWWGLRLINWLIFIIFSLLKKLLLQSSTATAYFNSPDWGTGRLEL